MALGLHKDERLGLAAAVVLHAAVLGALFLDPHSDQQVEPPQRIEVTISDDYALTSTSPDPNSQAAASVAPTIGEAAPAAAPMPDTRPSPLPPEPEPEPEPDRPAPQPKKTPPRPAETRKPAPKKEPKKEPVREKAESRKPEPKKAPPKEKTDDRKKSAIDDIVKKKSEGSSSKESSKPAEKTGGSRIGADFLEGVTGAKSTEGKGTPAATIGPQVRSALSAAITRQLKPHWQAPQGPEAEELVTYLAFRLNKDGSLDGRPTVVRQSGITDVNRNQASRHAEQAIKAVQLAAPFNLPAEYYDAWKRVSSFKFDKRLSQ